MAGQAKRSCEVSPELMREYKAYLAQPDGWKLENRGKIVVFKDGELQGTFPDLDEALGFALSRFGDEVFLIQKVGDEDRPRCTTRSLLGFS